MWWFSKFSRSEETVADLTLYAPISGNIVPIEDVPDIVFSEKIIGDGIAIKPTSDKVLAPCNCVVQQIFETNHAILLKTIPHNLSLFIHIGIDSIELKGEGFNRTVEEGDTVKTGDTLIAINLNFIQNHAKSTITPIIISSQDQSAIAKFEKSTGNCTAGETPLLKINIKKEPAPAVQNS